MTVDEKQNIKKKILRKIRIFVEKKDILEKQVILR
jgi:hypothetical protein